MTRPQKRHKRSGYDNTGEQKILLECLIVWPAVNISKAHSIHSTVVSTTVFLHLFLLKCPFKSIVSVQWNAQTFNLKVVSQRVVVEDFPWYTLKVPPKNIYHVILKCPVFVLLHLKFAHVVCMLGELWYRAVSS